ncbi:MAG: transporter [Proteobacteria bacterium]|nr:transporter [Pseudomonadota bacterium]
MIFAPARGAAAAALACAVAASLLAPSTAHACATCGCTLSTDAAMGYAAETGWRANLEFNYIDQSQLRHGTGAADGVPPGNELENDTINRYWTLGLAYSPNLDWNFALRIPYVNRSHTTYGEYDPDAPLPDLSASHSSSIGDARLLVTWQGLLPTHNLGVQLGIKLPTGDYGTQVKFYSGPLEGEPLDASLQPGTGSTDILVGAFYYQAISEDWDAFVSANFQAAVASKQDQPGNDFRPGNQTTLSGGLRYEANPDIVPQFQLNASYKSHDQGALADTEGSQGTVVYFSPGVTFTVAHNTQLYVFAQVPVYSNLDGYQLFPRWTATGGVSVAF